MVKKKTRRAIGQVLRTENSCSKKQTQLNKTPCLPEGFTCLVSYYCSGRFTQISRMVGILWLGIQKEGPDSQKPPVLGS